MELPKKRKKSQVEKKVILAVIILTTVTVVVAAILALNLKPESRIQSKVEALAADYYENYLYADILDNNKGGDVTEIVKKYEDTGFSPVTLRQILLHDANENAEFYDYFRKYCDENETLVKFFPENPYKQRSYRVEYTYSCEYE